MKMIENECLNLIGVYRFRDLLKCESRTLVLRHLITKPTSAIRATLGDGPLRIEVPNLTSSQLENQARPELRQQS